MKPRGWLVSALFFGLLISTSAKSTEPVASPKSGETDLKIFTAAAIGPITAATLRDHGVRAAIRAKRYTIEALAKAIVQYFT